MRRAEDKALAGLGLVGMGDSEAGVLLGHRESHRTESQDLEQEIAGHFHIVEAAAVEEGEEEGSDLDWRAELHEEEQCRRAEQSSNHGIALAAAD
jgi:hypothetical protein